MEGDRHWNCWSVLSTIKLGFQIFSSSHKCTRLLLTVTVPSCETNPTVVSTEHRGYWRWKSDRSRRFLMLSEPHTALHPHSAVLLVLMLVNKCFKTLKKTKPQLGACVSSNHSSHRWKFVYIQDLYPDQIFKKSRVAINSVPACNLRTWWLSPWRKEKKFNSVKQNR